MCRLLIYLIHFQYFFFNIKNKIYIILYFKHQVLSTTLSNLHTRFIQTEKISKTLSSFFYTKLFGRMANVFFELRGKVFCIVVMKVEGNLFNG